MARASHKLVEMVVFRELVEDVVLVELVAVVGSGGFSVSLRINIKMIDLGCPNSFFCVWGGVSKLRYISISIFSCRLCWMGSLMRKKTWALVSLSARLFFIFIFTGSSSILGVLNNVP